MPSIEELQIISYMLEKKDVSVVIDLTDEHFPIHGDILNFILRFKKEYDEVPTTDTVLNRFTTFEPVELENLTVVKDALKEDLLHRKLKPVLVNAAKLVGEKNTIEALQALKIESTRMLKQIKAEQKGYSYTQEAGNRLERYLKIHGRDPSEILGISTGFSPLDLATNGLESGGDGAVDYFLVFAPTNMGKTLLTSFMLQAGWNAVNDYSYPAYFALEQKATEVARNWDNVLGKVSRLGLTRGTLTEEQKWEYEEFVERLQRKTKDIRIYDMEDFGGKLPNANELRRILESEGHTHFALDQLSKLTPSIQLGDLRQRLFVVSQEVRAMTLETEIPGFVVAQANRDSARRVKKDSSSSVDGEDIGEAYAIMQDATKSISVVKVSPSDFRITLVKNRENESGQSFVVRYDFESGLVVVMNDLDRAF